MFRENEQYPITYIMNAAAEDGGAQDELMALTQEAARFIFELADKAKAADIDLPRHYRVQSRITKTIHKKELRHYHFSLVGGQDYIKVAECNEQGIVHLKEIDGFIEHINSGLLAEIGEFFVERSRKNRQKTGALNKSMEDVRLLRQIIADEDSQLGK